ncbi:hypothetical protein IMSAG025_02519 [Muribaculaceae bacterium]|nr:hypothetical protein IMSAG025_02519 [Muribaculaceae bacterium]
MESVTQLERSDFLILRIRIQRIACLRIQEDAARKERSFGDISSVHKYVVVTVDIPVGTTLDRSSEE